MRTVTIMSANTPEGTVSLHSSVVESTESALAHLQHMTSLFPDVEPVYVTTGSYWRWTWEYVNELGVRCNDTVRMIA